MRWSPLLAKVIEISKSVGLVFLLVPRALIFPIMKPFTSVAKAKHDAGVLLKEAFGVKVSKGEKEYQPPIEVTECSKRLGIQIPKQEKGRVSFLASRALTGDIPYLDSKQLGKVKNRLYNVNLFKEDNKVVIEIDVRKIADGIRNEYRVSGTNGKNLLIEAISNEIDFNLKGLAEITGGEFKTYADRKLLYSIAQSLYIQYNCQMLVASETSEYVGDKKSSAEFLSSWQSRVNEYNCKERGLGYG